MLCIFFFLFISTQTKQLFSKTMHLFSSGFQHSHSYRNSRWQLPEVSQARCKDAYNWQTTAMVSILWHTVLQAIMQWCVLLHFNQCAKIHICWLKKIPTLIEKASQKQIQLDHECVLIWPNQKIIQQYHKGWLAFTVYISAVCEHTCVSSLVSISRLSWLENSDCGVKSKGADFSPADPAMSGELQDLSK